MLRDTVEILLEADKRDPVSFLHQQDRKKLRQLVTFFEAWANERGVSSILHTMRFMAEAIAFKQSLDNINPR